MTRKTPVTHRVHSYVRDGKVVRSYTRGKGWLSSEKTHTRRPINAYLEPSKKRWVQIADGPDYQWRSTENPEITVNVNLEEMENDLIDYEEDDEATYKVYLVFPSRNGRGIPNSPDQYSEGSSGNMKAAKGEAIEMAKRIMKLPIEKIERFDWEMVN